MAKSSFYEDVKPPIDQVSSSFYEKSGVAVYLNGNVIVYGNGAPTSLVGLNGDFYIDTATNYLYGPKANDTWPSGVSLVGPAGPQGPQGPSGTGSGDVIGPATNSNGYIPTWNGANSKTLANGIDPATLLTTAAAAAAYQPLDSDLTSIAALTTTAYGRGLLVTANQAALITEAKGWSPSAADKYLYSTGAGTSTEGAITTAGRALIDDADATAQRTTLGLAIGTNVEAWSANLDTLSAPGNWKVTYTNGTGVQTALTVGAAGTALCGNGVTSAPSWQGVCLTENNLSDVTAATARTNLGLAIGTNVQAYSANLATLASPGNWKVFYTDGSGNQTAVALGAANTALVSTGASAAPTAQAIGVLAVANQWTAHQISPLGTLTDGANISWTVSTYQKAKVTLGGNRTMSAVTGAVEGTTYYLWVLQDGTGSRTLSWTTTGAGSFDFGTAGAPTLTTTASKGDLLTFEAISIAGTLKLRYCGIAKGFA